MMKVMHYLRFIPYCVLALCHVTCRADNALPSDEYALSPAAYFGVKPDGDILQARLRFASNLDENLKDAARILREGDYRTALAIFNQIRWVTERRNDHARFAEAVAFEVHVLIQTGHLEDAIRIADELFDAEQFDGAVSQEYFQAFEMVSDELFHRGLFEDLDVWLHKFEDPDRWRSPFHWWRESHPSQAFLAQYPNALSMYRSKLVQAQTLVNPLPARVVELATTERFPVPRPSNFRLCLSVLAILVGLWITIWLVHKVSWNHRSKITFRGHSDSVFDEEEANFLPIPEVADPVLRTIIRRYTSVGVFFLASLAFTLPLLLASLSEGTFWPIAEIRQTYLRAFGDRISFSVLGPLIVVLACRLCTAIGCVYIRLQNEFDVDKKAIDNEAKRFSKIGVPLAGAIGAVLAFVFLCLKWKSFRMYGIPPAPSGLFLAASLCIIIFIFFSSLVRWWMFSDSLASLLRNVTPNPLHADGHCGLRFIGDVCIDFFLLLAAGGVCLVVLAVQDQLLHRAPGIELIFILPWIVGSTILVILPIYHTHRIIVRERRNRLDDCSLRLSRHTMYDEELEKLRAEHEALRSSSRWPINVSAASAVLAAVILQTILPSILKRWIG